MPEKIQLDKQIALFMVLIPFLVTLANALDDRNSDKSTNWKHFFIQLIVGTISGLLFGFFACWIIGENIYAVGAISGAGSVLGVKGIRRISLIVEKYIESKFK
jgi:hypothetical protein